jgi:glycosyltransferase involved in cell wall biosynthesis
MAPTVSVVIAAFDAERFLAETLDSVLAQDHPEMEIVLVDDGSTDATPEIARSYGGVTYVRQPNRGLGAAQNHGLAIAGGEYVSFLDADDLWLPTKTSRELAVLTARPDVDMVFAQVEQFGTGPIAEAFRVLPGYSTGTLLLARTTFDRVGPFSESVTVGPFLEWYLRALDAGLVAHVLDDVLMHRRIHEHNMGVRLREQQSDYLRILKAAMDRRRSPTD